MTIDTEDLAHIKRLEGKTVKAAEPYGDDDQYIRITFTDGSVCELEGLGYDGLWDVVLIDWPGDQA